ncbi:MAG: hypothetical protein GY810_00835 [Aureispira sp.]|nr:hypothetical protein [Aureispira sp.]
MHHKKSKRRKRHAPIPVELTWTLYRYMGASTSTLDGMTEMPSFSLANQLSVEFVLTQLNLSNCFDFDYTPSEGDCLKIRHIGSGFLSFIFKNRTWTIGSYDPFRDSTERVQAGKVQEL